MEQYDSPEALDAHSKTDYFPEANKRLARMVAAAPEIEILDALVLWGRKTSGASITRPRAPRIAGLLR